MIPQNVRDILANEQNSNLFQIIALLIFMIFFIGLVMYIFSRPKKHYDEEANAPLDDEEKPFNL